MVTSSSLPLSNLALLVSLSAHVLAAPRSSFPLSMNLHRRVPQARSYDEITSWAKTHKQGVEAKYGNPSSIEKRASSGQNLCVSCSHCNSSTQFNNITELWTRMRIRGWFWAFWYLAHGLIVVQFLWFRCCWYTCSGLRRYSWHRIFVRLFTISQSLKSDFLPSSDLWLTSSSCTNSACQGIPSFDPSSSSSFENLTTSFSITYGSGEAAGTLGQDIVQMAGFSVSNQIFAVCDEVSSDLLTSPVSGLIGLAFQTISSSGAMPLWETLASSGAWTEQLMAFQLTRSAPGCSIRRIQLTIEFYQIQQWFQCAIPWTRRDVHYGLVFNSLRYLSRMLTSCWFRRC